MFVSILGHRVSRPAVCCRYLLCFLSGKHATHTNHHQHHCLHSNNLYSPFLSRLSFLANTPYFPTLCLKCHLPHLYHGLPGALDTSTLSNWLIVSHECRISNKNSKVVLLRTMRLSIKVKQKVNPQKSSFGLQGVIPCLLLLFLPRSLLNFPLLSLWSPLLARFFSLS